MREHECVGGRGAPCPFSERQFEIKEYDGKFYCDLHLPLESPSKLNAKECLRMLGDAAFETTLSGIELTGEIKTWRRLRFHSCRFSRISFVFVEHDLSLSLFDCVFEQDTQIYFLGDFLLSALETIFEGDFSAYAIKTEKHPARAVFWELHSTVIRGSTYFEDIEFAWRLDLETVTFHGPVRLDGAQFPQMCFLQARCFAPGAVTLSSEGSYRHARVQFANRRARDLEGLFYSLEKRCQRQRMGSGLEKFANWTYDVTAEYGQNYVRAFCCLIGLQAVAGSLYGFALKDCWQSSVFSNTINFTLSQVAKPFSLFSDREFESWQTTASGCGFPGHEKTALLVGTLVHGSLSLVLLALVALALRWRFKRD